MTKYTTASTSGVTGVNTPQAEQPGNGCNVSTEQQPGAIADALSSDHAEAVAQPLEVSTAQVLQGIEATPAPAQPLTIGEQPLCEIDNRFLDPDAELPRVLTWGKLGDTPSIPRHGIVAFSAREKQGKSTMVYTLLRSIITGKQIDTFTPSDERPRLVIVFDVEMDDYDLQPRLKVMSNELGEYKHRFGIVPLKSKVQDLAAVQAEINDVCERYNPDIAVIDTCTTMVNDLNSAAESAEFGRWLLSLSATRTVVTVIHQNKSREDDNMTGHLGSEIARIMVERYAVTKTETKSATMFKMTAKALRSGSAAQAPELNVEIHPDGKVTDAVEALRQQRKDDIARIRKELVPVFGDDTELRRSDLISRIIKAGIRNSNTRADNYITDAKEKFHVLIQPEGKRGLYQLAPESE